MAQPGHRHRVLRGGTLLNVFAALNQFPFLPSFLVRWDLSIYTFVMYEGHEFRIGAAYLGLLESQKIQQGRAMDLDIRANNFHKSDSLCFLFHFFYSLSSYGCRVAL